MKRILKRSLSLSVCLILLVSCSISNPMIPGDNKTEIEEESELVTYNKDYELTYNAITETSDRFSSLVLSRDNTFSMSVNTCNGVDVISGKFYFDEDQLVLVPPLYACDYEVEECDFRGYIFQIKNPNELIILHGLYCIPEESVFTIQ